MKKKLNLPLSGGYLNRILEPPMHEPRCSYTNTISDLTYYSTMTPVSSDPTSPTDLPDPLSIRSYLLLCLRATATTQSLTFARLCLDTLLLTKTYFTCHFTLCAAKCYPFIEIPRVTSIISLTNRPRTVRAAPCLNPSSSDASNRPAYTHLLKDMRAVMPQLPIKFNAPWIVL